MSKKEFVLEGLDCAHCASKIQEKVNKEEGVKNATVNFANQVLTVELEKEIDILTSVKQIVHKLEPDIVVKEKYSVKKEKIELKLENIDCASCAIKIENSVCKLNGIESATVNFTTGKMLIETTLDVNPTEKLKEVIKTVKKTEPDVSVAVISKSKNKEIKEDKGIVNKKHLSTIILGFLLFGAGFIFGTENILGFILFLISYIVVGGSVLLKAGKNILRGQIFDENFLMGIATIGAFAIGEYPEGVAVMLFYQTGEFIQSIAVNRSRKSISALMDIRPDYANIKVGEDVRKVNPDEVRIGDIIIVKAGEKIPLDGKVIEGTSMLDTSALTGESIPREVEIGDDVLSGFVNKNGLLLIEVTKEFGESTVVKILDLVQNANSKKAPTENFITKFARHYTPVVVGIATLLAIFPPLVLEGATFSEWIYRALVFLVISCPCALVISIPLGFFGGIGGASKKGILVKGGNYLEALNNVDTIIFDKTGTLTKGNFKVTEIKTFNDFSKEELLETVAYAESFSNHPIATSILEEYNQEINKAIVENYEEISGHGIKVTVDKKQVLAGNLKLMKLENINTPEFDFTGTVVHVSIEGQYAGYVIVADQIKEDAQKAIQQLRALGVKKTVMLTGDNYKTAKKVAEHLKLDEFHAELLPHEKVAKLEEIEKTKVGKLAFVGDGINDAPVLARADIGIAMGGLGSDAAIEAADVVIMTDEPSRIADAIKVAKRTRRIVWQNIILAMVVKLVAMLLGAMGFATIWEAVIADVGVTVLAVLNAMRVLNIKKL